MNVQYSDEPKQTFVVDGPELKKLARLLQDRIGKVHISVECVDGISREFNTVRDLIAYENSKSKRIHRIHIRSRSNDYSKSATIVFRDSFRFGAGVSIDVIGREDVVSRLKEEILDVMAGMRPWYNVIARADLFIVLVIGYGILYFIAKIVVGFKWAPLSDSSVSQSSRRKAEAIVLLFFLGVYGLDQLRGFLFPKLVFTIGQGESRFRLLEKVRWCVIIALLVSIIAGIITKPW